MNSTPFGLLVQIEAHRRCCSGTATIETGGGDEYLNLVCTSCGMRCGKMTHRTAEFLLAIVNKFGCPTEPIILRRGHYQEISQ